MSERQDTIAAIATAPGRGGVAVVRVSGPDAWSVAEAVTGRKIADADAGRFFRVRFADVDDGLMLVFKAPRSYTGEDAVELQGHGGTVAPRRVLEACFAAGARLARRGEFTERAFLNGRLDLSAAEAVIDLVDARTERAADDAFARLGGALKLPYECLYADLIELSSRLEHALDFDEGELPESFNEQNAAAIAACKGKMDSLISTAREGRLLREGALVVLAGAPNAGKSSLMNALLGSNRAIVSATAGTTRDTIEESLVIGGWAVRLTDTAGLRSTSDKIEAEGVARAESLIARADLVLALDCEISATNSAKIIHLHAKCDLNGDSPQQTGTDPRERGQTPAKGDRPLAKGDRPLAKGDSPLANGDSPLNPQPSTLNSQLSTVGDRPLAVSALTGEGLEELKMAIAVRLAEQAAKAAEAPNADVTTRQREHLERAVAALARAESAPDCVIAAGEVREAASEVGKIVGREYSDDLLEALFSRFCVGK